MEMQLGRIVIGSIFFELLVLGIALWLMYWVTKRAIRDGIRESGLIEEMRRANRKGSNEPVEPSFMRER
jgi:hypothetical protein